MFALSTASFDSCTALIATVFGVFRIDIADAVNIKVRSPMVIFAISTLYGRFTFSAGSLYNISYHTHFNRCNKKLKFLIKFYVFIFGFAL
jgi:hypothetical protein